MDPTHDREFQAALLKVNDPVQHALDQVLFWRTVALLGWASVVVCVVTLTK